MPKADPVTPAIRAAVLKRDGWDCVAPRLGATEPCRDRWGQSYTRTMLEYLTLDHVQERYGRMGRRAPSDCAHLVTLCWHHHLDGWATAHRAELREYLASAPPCEPEWDW